MGGHTYFVRPFGGWKSANMSGEIFALLTPILASVAPLVNGGVNTEGGVSILDIDAEKAAPAIANAMSGLSGDKVEKLMKKLLVDYQNISVQLEGKNDAELLTADLADELFCGETQDMFILVFDVIKANYSSFFKRLGGQFGNLLKGLLEKV
jgi:hypothetical protein